MRPFVRLFNMNETQVKNTCVLLPLLNKDILNLLGVKNFSRGKLYGAGNSEYFTAIHTGIGPALLGDAVLYLEETPCKYIILFGSCGLVRGEKGLDIGNLVVPWRCYSMESFTEMLLAKKNDYKAISPDKTLLDSLLKEKDIKTANCATIGSLKLEKTYLNVLKEKDIDILDMECSALLSAAGYIKRRSIALFYITDIINKKPFYRDFDAKDKLKISGSIKSAIHILCNFIKKNLSD